MKTCIIYANCQGVDGLYNLCISYPEFCAEYTIKCISVHEFVNTDKELDTELLKSADIFLHQPVNKYHGEKSTDHIKEHVLKPECKCIAFPYIYNCAVSSTYIGRLDYISSQGTRQNSKDDLNLFRQKALMHGFGHVYQLIQSGKPLDDIIEIYRKGTLTFDFDERWETCMKLLRTKEQQCDVKVADFMEENKDKMLLLSVNHPTTIVFWHMFLQIIEQLNITAPKNNPSLLPYDVSGMIKNIGNHPFQQFVQHYNINTKIMSHLDSYSKSHWGKSWEYVVSDNHTEWEIMDFYMKYKNLCTLV